MTEGEIVGGHHCLDRHEFEQIPGDGEGQGSLVCFSPWDHKESDMTEQLNNNNIKGRKRISIRTMPCYALVTVIGWMQLSKISCLRQKKKFPLCS